MFIYLIPISLTELSSKPVTIYQLFIHKHKSQIKLWKKIKRDIEKKFLSFILIFFILLNKNI